MPMIPLVICLPSLGPLLLLRLALLHALLYLLLLMQHWGRSPTGAGRTVLDSMPSRHASFLFLFLIYTNYTISFENVEIAHLTSVNNLGLEMSSNLSWRNHIEFIAKSTSKKLGVLFRCRSFFSSSELLRLYVGLIRPCLEYCTHVWGGSPFTRILDRMEAKAFRLINNTRLTSFLTIFYSINFGHCSLELRFIIPPSLPRPRSTRQAASSHNFCVRLFNEHHQQGGKPLPPPYQGCG